MIQYIKTKLLLVVLLSILSYNQTASQIPYPGVDPGIAVARIESGNKVFLENNVLSMEFGYDDKKLWISGFEDVREKYRLQTDTTPLFELILRDGSRITSDDFILLAPPATVDVNGDPASTVYANRFPGKKYSAQLENKKNGLSLHWEADLRDGSNYIHQIFKFRADNTGDIKKVVLIKLPDHETRLAGTVDGSPIVHKNMFFALEYPLSRVEEKDNFTTISMARLQEELATIWGVTPSNQLRRGFLYYVERERSHPYHQVLHYNSWFDISWDEPFTEAESLDRIKMFGDSLIIKRGIPLKAFLLDDGWDDHKTLWSFHKGFPIGFDRLRQLAHSYNSGIGVWFSPFGGYGEAKRLRIEYGEKQVPPFETNSKGFSMSGPVYYNRFREVTFDFANRYDVTMYKFDGLGAGNDALDVYKKDVEAFLRLMKELQALKPDLYISITTGTWPSVHWLQYGDNIWRGGLDTDMTGEGSNRQQWITYRDADVYENVVKRGPLYPLNALMLCGICIADHGNPGTFEMNDKDISDEIWSFFATGTNLQELYINPHKLNTKNWDCLADAARWARENESVLVDTHWIGGDPAKGEVYGYASWSEDKGILSLRNPSGIVKTFKVILKEVFELPDYVNDNYELYDVRALGDNPNVRAAYNGRSCTITLAPFEHKVFEALLGQ